MGKTTTPTPPRGVDADGTQRRTLPAGSFKPLSISAALMVCAATFERVTVSGYLRIRDGVDRPWRSNVTARNVVRRCPEQDAQSTAFWCSGPDGP